MRRPALYSSSSSPPPVEALGQQAPAGPAAAPALPATRFFSLSSPRLLWTALAVALCEEALAARGWVPLLWGPLRAALAAGRATLDDCLREVHGELERAGKSGGEGDGWGQREE